jgi:hypothetical protein
VIGRVQVQNRPGVGRTALANEQPRGTPDSNAADHTRQRDGDTDGGSSYRLREARSRLKEQASSAARKAQTQGGLTPAPWRVMYATGASLFDRATGLFDRRLQASAPSLVST